jgi:tetratricopeptide (TPR) repeat protein
MKTVNVEEREMQNVTENSLDLINQGCALMAQQQYEQALEKFLLAQKDSPKYIDCYVNLGNVYSCLEKYDDALENFKKALWTYVNTLDTKS